MGTNEPRTHKYKARNSILNLSTYNMQDGYS